MINIHIATIFGYVFSTIAYLFTLVVPIVIAYFAIPLLRDISSTLKQIQDLLEQKGQ
jgi:hypothetical protein